jgi:hypothetical protein
MKKYYIAQINLEPNKYILVGEMFTKVMPDYIESVRNLMTVTEYQTEKEYNDAVEQLRLEGKILISTSDLI